MHGGKNAASYQPIDCSNENVLMFERSKNGASLTFVANLTDKEQSIENKLAGKYLNYMTNEKEEYSAQTKSLTFKPWEYKILIH